MKLNIYFNKASKPIYDRLMEEAEKLDRNPVYIICRALEFYFKQKEK